MKTFFENLNKYWVAPIIAIIGGLLGLYFSIIKQDLETQAQELKNATMRIEAELKQKEYTNEVRLHAYSEVKDAIVNKDKKLQEAALLIVNVLLEDNDSAFKNKLIDLMRYSPYTSDSIKTEILKIDSFNIQQQYEPRKKFTIDIFYLDDIKKEAYPRARRIQALLSDAFPKSQYQVRLRLLPRTINVRSGYKISENQIRYEKSEEDVAKKCLDIIKSKNIFPNELPRMYEIKGNTENYISVFVRNM